MGHITSQKEAGQVLGIRRNNPTRREQISNELGECREHLREVASIIAGGAAERLGPRIEHAKEAVSPKMEKARGAALHGLESMTVALGGQPRKTRRWPMLVGALGVGLVAGAVGALVMQRNNSRWDEYEPVQVLGMDESAEKVKTAAQQTADQVREAGATVKDTAQDVASDVKETVKNSANAAESAKKATKDS